MSLRAHFLNFWLRHVEKPAMARATTPDDLRKRFARSARLCFHAPRGTQMQWLVLEHASRRAEALEVVPKLLDHDGVVFYIHGGAFIFGSPRTHAAMAGTLGKMLSMRVVLPKYRLAPEHPFPAGLEDVRTAWQGLVASGVPADRIVIGGDSAGGALALSLLAQLLRDGMPPPAGVFCLSPLTDLTYSGESFTKNAAADAVLAPQRAGRLAQMYLQGHAAEDPKVSPLFAAFAGAPPIWITAGDTEILVDDARRMSAQMQSTGVDVTYVEARDLPHVWPLFHNALPEARGTLGDVAGWIRQCLHAPDES